MWTLLQALGVHVRASYPPPWRQVVMNHIRANLLLKGNLNTEWKVHTNTDAHTQSDWFAASSSESQRSSLGVSYAEHDRHRLVEHYFIAGICSALLRSPFSFYLHCFSLSLLHPAFSRRRLSRHSFLFCTYVIYSLLFLILRRENPHNYFLGFAPPCVTSHLPCYPTFLTHIKQTTLYVPCATHALLHLFIVQHF